MEIGYCTNVHAGHDLDTTRENLAKHAIEVKQAFRPDETMGIGLWLSAASAERLLADSELAAFADWLKEQGLVPFTLNGFPYGNFHQPVVKHDVYLPTWEDPKRLDYTINLIRILHALLPEGLTGSISTLPLLWGDPKPSEDKLRACAKQLLHVAEFLRQFEEETGRLIFVCIEPEPGCVIETSNDIVSLFERYLLEMSSNDLGVRRYLRVCHDVCHGAVMFEHQSDVMRRYQKAGIIVGKVQVSSAIKVDFDRFDDAEQRRQALEELKLFSEDRYLHQTVVHKRGRSTPEFFEDLPKALDLYGDSPVGEWRVHYHVPVFLEKFGLLETTQPEIIECLKAIEGFSNVKHFEVETYAWNVLPEALKQPSLADGIARELSWFREQCEAFKVDI